MKKRLVLKPFVLPVVYMTMVIALVLSVYFINKPNAKLDEELTYVSGAILDEYVPVISTDTVILRPYTSENITIGKNYYDYKAPEDEQKNSIIYHENTYLQNTGIDYIQNDVFDVVSILDGEVIEVEDKELLGKSVTIRHNNEIISVYQSLSQASVKKGDKVVAGQVIGKSGTCELNKDLGNHLHFELTVNGVLVDPENYLDKKLNEIN